MAAPVRTVRGADDLLADAHRRHQRIIDVARAAAADAGYAALATPIFEFVDVFARTLGDETDVVSKEMYVFEDRGGDRLALRPEGTASVCRALISNGLTQELPFRAFYAGPMFRYERPQKGRRRQFHQIGAELLGPRAPLADVEAIALGWRVLKRLGVNDRVVLKINTLGDRATRARWSAALADFLRGRIDALSADSKRRLETNPLRILDSKAPEDQAALDGAPRLEAMLDADGQAFFAAVRAGLDRLAIPHQVEPNLVRGLDYYEHTAFEFVTDALGAQGAVLAGGRYDGLVADLGGPQTPGVGWAAGIERLAELADAPDAPPAPVAVAAAGEGAALDAQAFAEALRDAGVAADIVFSGALKKRMARANKLGARWAVIIGEDEAAQGAATLRDLGDGGQETLSVAAAIEKLRAAR